MSITRWLNAYGRRHPAVLRYTVAPLPPPGEEDAGPTVARRIEDLTADDLRAAARRAATSGAFADGVPFAASLE
jgi:hypothetical protein